MATVKNTDIVKYFQNAVKNGWGYVWSLNGELYTKAKAEKYKAQGKSTSQWRDPDTYWTEDCARWFGKMAADCSGGIVGAMRTINPKYSDRSANTFKAQFVESGKINTIPEIPGLAVWRSGHIGIYEGKGYVLEFRGTEYGAVRTKLSQRDFTHWGKIKGVEYPADDEWVVNRLLKLTSPMQKGDDVKELQNRLSDEGFKKVLVNGKLKALKADGVFGEITEAAVMAFQKSAKLVVDGKAGRNTITALGGVYNA